MGRGMPLPSRLGGLRGRRKLPWRGPGRSPGEQRFYCSLSVLERLSLQRLLTTNVVHSRLLVKKNGFAQWVGCDPLRQPRQLPR